MSNSRAIEIASEQLLKALPQASADELAYWVRYHNDAYFKKAAPEISDAAFDKLVETLRMVKPDADVLEEMGEGASEATLTHREPMLSLDKCYDHETFVKWRAKVTGPIVGMPKIDGVACAVHYDEQGHFVQALTRGDGKAGEDITENVRRIVDVQKTIDGSFKTKLEVRGEVYMRISRFKAHFQDEFANPRNLAAGALKQKDASKSEAYGLSFFPYDIRGTPLESEREKFAFLERTGFRLAPIAILEEGEDYQKVVKQLASDRDRIDFEIDGVVFRADRISEQRRLGETAHHPRFAIAYKFQGESAQTHLEDVQWSVGRSGVITPVAIVKPVFVSGATVTRASLHNLGLFLKHHLSKGALVEIVRRGGVIPHVERVLRSEGPLFVAPEQCPSCGREVVIDGDFLRCGDPSQCIQIQIARILHYCAVLDIDGFGEKWVRVLVEKKLVRSAADLYRLKVEDLLQLDRMGAVLAAKLIAAVQARREVPLWQFVCALGFDEVGPTVAQALAQHFDDFNVLRQASAEELTSIFGIGASIASALTHGFKDFAEGIDDLLSEVRIVKEAPKSQANPNHPLFNKTVVFTGKMALLERKEAQKRVRECGGQTPSSVSAATDFVVVGDEGSALIGGGEKSTKHKSAEKLIQQGASIKLLSERAFLALLDGTPPP